MANKKRLIYADAFFKEADKALFMGFRAEERKRNFLDMISAMLDNCPTVDAVEVVHGRWELVEYPSSPFGVDQEYQCTICGTPADYEYLSRYCPNCGAKMDGGNEDG